MKLERFNAVNTENLGMQKIGAYRQKLVKFY